MYIGSTGQSHETHDSCNGLKGNGREYKAVPQIALLEAIFNYSFQVPGFTKEPQVRWLTSYTITTLNPKTRVKGGTDSL